MDFVNAFVSALLSLFLILSQSASYQHQATPQQPARQTTAPTLAKAENSDTSRNWAGYMASNGTYTGVSGTWTVPSITDTSQAGADATWVGIGGVESGDLIQAGTQTTVDDQGSVSYGAFYEDLPHSSRQLSLPVRPGDTMFVSVQKEKATLWNITVRNKTTGQSANLSLPYDSSLSSAEWIEEAPTGVRHVIPLDNFGKIYISSATAVKDGKTVTAQDANARPISMSGATGTTLAESSVLNTDGAGFTVSRTTEDASVNQPQADVVYMVPQGIPLFVKHVFRFGY